MYADPSKIRDHVIKIRLNDNEEALIDALVSYTGEQKAAFLRELLLEQAHQILSGGDFIRDRRQGEGHQRNQVGH